MGKVSEVREIERAIPRVRYATDICLTKMSLGVKYIAAKLTSETSEGIQACDTTYDDWYQRLRATKVADVAKELGLTTDQFALSLGFDWSPDVIRVEFRLEESAIINLSETIGAMGINEEMALMLAFSQQRFVAGPLMILAETITECSLEPLFSYLVMAEGDMKGLLALAEILKKKDAQGYPKPLKAMKLSLWHWFYCTLVYSSDVFVGIDSTQPLFDGKQLTSEVAGFLTPNQLADFTLSEVEDLIPMLAFLLTPIYGAIGILRYPTKPLRLASETFSTSILTFLKNKKNSRLPTNVGTRAIHD